MSRVVIIGAGHAGSQLAVSLRDEAFPGEIVLVDAEPAIPYHKPPLSKVFLTDPSAQAQLLRSSSAYDEAGVTRVVGTVDQVDVHARTVSIDGRPLPYDDLVFATGARNRALPEFAGAANVFQLRTVQDASLIREALAGAGRIAIIGGGYIGLETAAALAQSGKDVTLLVRGSRVLERTAAPVTAELLTDGLRRLGVSVRTSWRTTEVSRVGDRIVELRSGEQTIPADLVLAGVGASPAIELAQHAGIACSRGILTDAHMATSAPRVWAIGDVAEMPHWQSGESEVIESVQNATDQARRLACTLASGTPTPFRAVPWFWSDIGPFKLQIAGLVHRADAHVVRAADQSLAVFHLRGDRLVAVETVNSGVDHLIARRLLEQGLTPTPEQMLAGPAALKALLV